MTKGALSVRHGQREGAPRGARIVVLARERPGRLAIRSQAGRKTEPHGGARWQPDPLTKADDRIEYEAGRSRERAAVKRQRVAGVPAAAQKASAIGLPFERTLRTTLEAQRVERPGRDVARISRPSMAQQGGAVRQILGFDE